MICIPYNYELVYIFINTVGDYANKLEKFETIPKDRDANSETTIFRAPTVILAHLKISPLASVKKSWVINFDLFERTRSPTSLRSRGSSNPSELMTRTA